MLAVLSRSPWRRALAVLGAVVLLLVGVWFGGHPSWLPTPLRSAFVSQDANEQLVQTTLGLISKNYYRPVDTSALLNTGLEAAVAGLDDPYSHYFPPALYESFQQETDSEVVGIGVEVGAEPVRHGIQIEEVFAGSPAAKAKLQRGEIITAVGATSLAGKSLTQGANLIKGPAGTSVELTVLDGKRARTVRLTRASVSIPVASSKLVHYDGKAIGYLRFTQFAQSSAQELSQQVRRMQKAGAQGLVLDLRENPGGLLAQAVGVASIFIRHGTIVTTRGRSQPTTVYTALGDAIAPTIPLVVLVDRGTASSAEIVTGALKDRGRAKVVGTNTYGKGVFQQIQPLPGGGALDITVGEYYTPNGQNLGDGGVKEGKGITPNIRVPAGDVADALKVAERTVAAEIK